MAIFLTEPETGDRVLRAQSGWDKSPRNWRHHPGMGLSENAVLTGKLQYTPDVTREPKFIAGRTDTRSEIDVPIKIDDKSLGVLIVEDPRVDAFGAADFDILQAVANQLAIALENARLLAQTQQDLARTQSLHELGTQILSAQTVAEIGEMIVKQIVRTEGIHSASIRLIDAQGQITFQTGLDAQGNSYTHAPPRPNGATMRVFRTGEPFIVNKQDAENTLISPPAVELGIKSLISLPLKVGQRVLGVLFLHYPMPRTFSAEEIRSFGIYANQAAMALERARLFEEQQASLAMTTRLYELSAQVLTATTIEETARFVTETVRAGFAADACTIDLFDESNMAGLRLSTGVPSAFDDEAQPRSHGLTARVRQSKEPIIATGEELNPRIRAEGVQTVIALPLLGEQECLGALFVGYRQPHQFSARERNLMSLFANHAALALRRVRLFHQAQQRLTELEAVNVISTALRSATTLEEMLPILLDETLHLFHTDTGFLSLHDRDSGEIRRRVVRGWWAEVP
ncbi:MAG: GAF domain-containing protein, partial [Chloroflexota bacterium]